MNEHTRTLIYKTLEWGARGFAALVLLLWGGFFIEHLTEWFIKPAPLSPPPKVWIGQGLHLMILVGLALCLRWPIPGLVLVAFSSFVFFYSYAGKNFPVFFGITVAPALVLAALQWLRNRTVLPLPE